MTKTDLVQAVVESAGLQKKQAQVAVDAILGAIEEALTEGDKVQIPGFGTFEVRERSARTGVNPKNPSEKIQIPACKTVGFKVGKTLKDSVNKGPEFLKKIEL